MIGTVRLNAYEKLFPMKSRPCQKRVLNKKFRRDRFVPPE
jgi:hypothetical protein